MLLFSLEAAEQFSHALTQLSFISVGPMEENFLEDPATCLLGCVYTRMWRGVGLRSFDFPPQYAGLFLVGPGLRRLLACF